MRIMASPGTISSPNLNGSGEGDLDSSTSQRPRPRSASTFNRRRAGNACQVCRARKTKCDNQRPVCGFCAATGGICRYVDLHTAHLDKPTLAILQRFDQMEMTLRQLINESMKKSPPMLDVGQPQSEQLLDADFADTVHGVNRHGAFSDRLMFDEGQVRDRLNRSGSDTPSDDMPPSAEVLRYASEMSVDTVMKWPIFTLVTPHMEREFHRSIIDILANGDRHQSTTAMGIALHNLTPDTVAHLVENFLANNHVKNPILDVESLRVDAREFAESGPQWDGRSCLMLLVCAISKISEPLDQETSPGPSKSPERLVLAEAYFQASQRRIGMLYHDNTLLGAQCSFLTAVYLMSTMKILAAWKSFVQAATQCLTWLERCGRMKTEKHKTQPPSDPETARTYHIEESLYWSCLKSEIELRFELGLPGSGLNEMRYPNMYPSPPADLPAEEAYNSPQTQWSSPRSYTTATDRQNLKIGWFFYLAEIALKRIVSNVFVWRHKASETSRSRAELDQNLERSVTEFEMQIHAWYEALPPSMKFPRDPTTSTDDIMRYILRGHMLDIREIARFSAIQEVLGSTNNSISFDAFSTISIRMSQEFLANAVNRIEANREGFYHRHQGTWLALRSCGRSALQLLGMACRCQMDGADVSKLARQDLEERFLPSQWKDVVSLVSDALNYWADESDDLKRLDVVLKELMQAYENMTCE